MINRKEDIINYLVRVIFIVLIFLFISAFSDNSSQQDNNSVVHHELITDLCAENKNAVIINQLQAPAFQKGWVSLIDRMNLKFSDENHKIFTDNKKIIQKYTSLQKNQLLIKPLLACKFYYHWFSLDAENLPILS